MHSSSFLRLSLPAAALLVSAALPSRADARTWSGTVHGARGGVYQRTVTHQPGQFSATGSATLPDGRTASRTVSTERTATGRTTQAQATGFDGRSATYQSSRTRTDTGYVRDVTATGRNGGTATKHVEVSRQNGTTTRTVTKTHTAPAS